MGSEHENGSNKHVDVKPLPVNGDSPEFSSSSFISSSSSSSSSLDELSKNKKDPLDTAVTKSQLDGNLQSPHWSTLRNASQMKYPPVQTMGRPGEYDPNRIPASIFSSKPSNPTEWSVASNESLFSIHMGNNSFSRDNAFLFGKSGELPRLEDWSSSQPNLPPVMEESSIKSGKVSKQEEDSHESSKVGPGANVESHVKEKIAPAADVVTVPPVNVHPVKVSLPVNDTNLNSLSTRTSSSNPRLSDESGNSGSSFVFPVLVSDGAKSSSSLNVVEEKPEKPESPAQTPKATTTTPKASEIRWFSCFWWPRCCF